MARLADWGLILIHGLPEGGHNHRLQLAAVERIAAECSLESFSFDWWPDSGELQTYRLLRSGDFGATLAQRFDEWLMGERGAALHGRRLIVVAYSLGGLILYNWAVGAAARRFEPGHVELAVTIAAPFQFSTGTVELQRPDGGWTRLRGLARQRVEPDAIVAALGQRLLVVQAEGDRTIIESDSDLASVVHVSQYTSPMPAHDASHNSHREIRTDGQALLAIAAAMAHRTVPGLLRFA